MKEKVVEILIYLMSEMQADKRLNEIDLADLKRSGYTQSEISAAFSWLYDNMEVRDGTVSGAARPSASSRRVFHDLERVALSVEAQGYLIQLRELGLLNERDIEAVIERAMLSGVERLLVDDLRSIVVTVLFAKGNDGYSSGDWMFTSKDSIH
jgi:Smg protein